MKALQISFLKYMNFFAQSIVCGLVIGSFFISPSWGMKREAEEDLDPGDLSQTFNNPLIQKDTPENQYEEGCQFLRDKQYDKAMDSFLEAAHQNHTEAKYKIGYMYEKKLGVEDLDHLTTALEWYSFAAKQNYPQALYRMGRIYDGTHVDQDYQQAMEYYLEAAKQNHPKALCRLGDMYIEALGVKQDINEAMKWFLLAAKQNNSYAQYNIGSMYEEGLGVERDYKQAMKWYLLAANQNDAYAHYNIAYMYEVGLGVEQDYKEAIKWYLLSLYNNFNDGDTNPKAHINLMLTLMTKKNTHHFEN